MDDWEEIVAYLLTLPPHRNIILPKDIGLPEGAMPTIGEPCGQIADWEIPIFNGGRIHLREYRRTYAVHWDYMSPKRNPLRHLRQDASHWYDLFGTAAGFFRRAYIKRK